jgi:hypothetical protein
MQAMHAAAIAMDRLQACLEAPGPLAFHHVRHVRGTMLLLDMAAALMLQPAACKMLLEHSQVGESLVPGAHSWLLQRQEQTSLQTFGVHSCMALCPVRRYPC